jgi:hypothetical protein
MWRLSLALLPLLLIPSQAAAMPQLLAALAGLIGPTGSLTLWFQGLPWLGQALVRLGTSLVLSFVAQALTPRPNQKRQLNIPNSRPPKRFIYGRFRTYGTPAPWRVAGKRLYGCIILNSRPSEGGDIKIWMDKRACFNGGAAPSSIYNFGAGGGADLEPIEDFRQIGPNVLKAWIGRGDQSGPPQQILDEVGPATARAFFLDTDKWSGRTVLWLRLDYGTSSRASRRWRAAPPEFEVEMDWSRVWDPRDNAQDPDDPDTWTYSSNQALCLLDSLTQNPIRRYPLRQIHLPSFIESADVADEPVALYHASVAAGVWSDPLTRLTEPRYTANGLLVWAANELGDQVAPLAQAGGGELVRIGGQVGYASGEYRAPLLTITDIVESGGVDYQVLKPGRDLPRFVKGVYISPDRDWQEAELEPLEVAGSTGGVGDDGILELTLPFVTSATQAMRVQQIVARQMAAQKTLGVTLWPEAADLAPGATIQLALPAPFTRWNRQYSILSADPAVWLSDLESEIAIRVPITARENNAAIYQWVPETDEQEIVVEAFDAARPDTNAPTNLTVQTGDGVSTPEQARFLINFTPALDAEEYEISFRRGGGEYEIVAVRVGTTNILLNVIAGETYDVRVVAVKIIDTALIDRQRSDPVEVLGVIARLGAEAAPELQPGITAGGPIARTP